jgi:hypothetical protein
MKNVRRWWGSMRRSLHAVSLSHRRWAAAARPTRHRVHLNGTGRDRTAYCLFAPCSPRWWETSSFAAHVRLRPSSVVRSRRPRAVSIVRGTGGHQASGQRLVPLSGVRPHRCPFREERGAYPSAPGQGRAAEVGRGQPFSAPPRPVPRRNVRWKIRNPSRGTRAAISIDARRTPICVCAWIAGSRTESGWRSGCS